MDVDVAANSHEKVMSGDEKNSHSLPGSEPPIIQPVAQRYTTELYRLTFHVGNIWQSTMPFCIYSNMNIPSLMSNGRPD
jgi:hypothetical protein